MGLFDRKVKRRKETGSALERYQKSFYHAMEGLGYSFFHEHNIIIIFTAILITTSFGFFFHINTFEWLFCVLIMGMVLGCEMINTAIEATIDLITTDTHPLAKIAKDTASSATLVFSITALIGAIIIFGPKIMALF